MLGASDQSKKMKNVFRSSITFTMRGVAVTAVAVASMASTALADKPTNPNDPPPTGSTYRGYKCNKRNYHTCEDQDCTPTTVVGLPIAAAQFFSNHVHFHRCGTPAKNKCCSTGPKYCGDWKIYSPNCTTGFLVNTVPGRTLACTPA